MTFLLISLPPPLTSPGSNSTVTPGLRTAAVVISSVGLGSSFLVLVIFISLLARAYVAMLRRGDKKQKFSVACLTYMAIDFGRHSTSITNSNVYAVVYVHHIFDIF